MWFVKLQAVTFSMSVCPHASPPSTPCYHPTSNAGHECQQCCPHDPAENSRAAVLWLALTPTLCMAGYVEAQQGCEEMCFMTGESRSYFYVPKFFCYWTRVQKQHSNGSIVRDSQRIEAPSHEYYWWISVLIWHFASDYLKICIYVLKSDFVRQINSSVWFSLSKRLFVPPVPHPIS